MKKLLSLTMAVILALFMVACESSDSTDPEDPINEAEVLLNFLEAGDANYEQWVNDLSGWIVNLGDINTDDYFVLDIRAVADYDTIHIPNAVNSTMANMFDVVATQNTSNKPILVVCYSGQSAAYSHTLLRLKGYEAYSLKWGMSIYNAYLDKWTGKCSNDYAADANWSTDASAALPSNGYPELSTGSETAEDILDARIDAAITAWSGGLLLGASTVMPDPSAYHIMNYWAVADWNTYGHIADAYQLDPQTLTAAANLSALDPAATNVLYCWTGQTAAATIAYLQVLGYDAKSIAYGVNSMIYDELAGHKWPKPW
jgi:rhodanese-related sulfurtransferase